FVVVVGYIGWQVAIGGEFQVGDIAFLVLILERISNAARQAGNISMSLGQASAAAERIFSFLDQVPSLRSRPGAFVLGDVAGAVEFDRVSFGYRPGQRVLDDLSFRIEPGQKVALVGKSGQGKSTLLQLIPRFY